MMMTKLLSFLARTALVVAAAFGLAAALPALAEEDRHGMVNDMEVPMTKEALAIGEERYKARCAYCHLASGRGGSSSVCLACQKYKWGSKSSDIYATIAAGRPGTKMGAFGNPETGLTREQIMGVIAYIRHLQELKIADDAKEEAATQAVR